MEKHLQEDWLDARLREEASYIEDGGFTARAVRQLPARRVRSSQRAVILFTVTLAASAITYLLSGGGRFITEAITRVAVMPLALIYLCAVAAGVLVMAIGLAAAISKTTGERLG